MPSGISMGLGCCPCCHKTVDMEKYAHCCPRCHKTFDYRKADSLQRTFAWTCAALVMLIPANIYPMMIFYILGKPDASNILEGLFTLIDLGMYPVAFIIFIASFIVPLSKIAGLFVLMYHMKWGTNLTTRQLTKIYNAIEFFGPWSMLDVFVVTIMATVVKLGFFTSIEAAHGVTFFALMVVTTMVAAEQIDTRLLLEKSTTQ
ncbi:paraquat-inducible protein A [Colwellia sp. MEBiC06753]